MMQVLLKYGLLLLLVAAPATVIVKMSLEDEAEKVERLKQSYLVDQDEHKQVSKMCKNLSERDKDENLECRAARLATSAKLREGYTDRGAPSRKLPGWE